MRRLILFLLILPFVCKAQVYVDTTIIDPQTEITFPADTVITISLTGEQAALITYGIRTTAPGYGIGAYLATLLNEAYRAGRVERDKVIMNRFWAAPNATKIGVANALSIPTDTKIVIP